MSGGRRKRGRKRMKVGFPQQNENKTTFFSLSKFHVVSERNGAGQRNQQRRLELYFSRHADRNRDTQDTAENWFFSYFILFLSWDFLVSLKIFRGLIPSKRISFFKRNFLQVLLGFVLTSPRFHVIAMMIILKLALFICSFRILLASGASCRAANEENRQRRKKFVVDSFKSVSGSGIFENRDCHLFIDCQVDKILFIIICLSPRKDGGLFFKWLFFIFTSFRLFSSHFLSRKPVEMKNESRCNRSL